jgi:hypothetical protein
MIERGAQAAVIVILKGHESEWLQHAVRYAPHRAQSLGHAMDWTRLCLKSDFDEIALAQRLSESQ